MHARSTSLLAALLLVCSLASCGDTQASAALRFTAIPDRDSSALIERFAPLVEHLSEQLGVPVEYVPLRDYPATVEAFRSGDVHLAWFGGVTGAQARAEVQGARAIAQGAVDPRFMSYFVANADTGIERSTEFPAALAGRSFTFGARDSTSGRVMPEYFLRQETGQTSEEFFSAPIGFSSGHDETARKVENGTYEVGAMNFRTYDTMVERGELDPARCRIVWVTPEYPDYNWTAHPELEEMFGTGFTERLQAALVGLESLELLAAVDRPEGLIPASNADFQPIVELADEMGFLD